MNDDATLITGTDVSDGFAHVPLHEFHRKRLRLPLVLADSSTGPDKSISTFGKPAGVIGTVKKPVTQASS